MTNGWLCDDCGKCWKEGSAVSYVVDPGDPACHHKNLRRVRLRVDA